MAGVLYKRKMTKDQTVGFWTCLIDWFIGTAKTHVHTKLVLESKDWDKSISVDQFDERDKRLLLAFVKKESEDNKAFKSYGSIVDMCNLLVK